MLAATTALIVVAVVLMSQAPAALAGHTRFRAPSSAEEAGFRRSVSLKLMLRSVRVHRVDLDDNEEEFVIYTFNNTIQRIADEDDFLLLGPDPDDEERADSAVLVETDRRSVLVGFRPGTDVRSFSLGAVETGTVESRDGKVNLQQSLPLVGRRGQQGLTAAPDLLWVSLDRSLERIRYVFDENLQEGGAAAQEFGYYTRSGRMHTGNGVVSVEKNVVTVAFDRRNGDHVEDGVRFFVLDGAVRDLQGHENPPRAVGGGTTRPDLISVRLVGNTMVDYTFDAPVTDVDPDEFTLWTGRAASYEGDAYTRPDARTVRVIFRRLRYVGERAVLAAAGPRAVRSTQGLTAYNTVGAMRLSPTRTPAGTVGPDLTGVRMDDGSGLVTFVFDEAISRRLTADEVNEHDFFIVTSAGDIEPGQEVAALGTNWVTILFNKDEAEDAVAAGVRAGAVKDDEGNGNPIGSVFR